MGEGLGIGTFESHPSHNPEREHSGGLGIIVFTTAPSQWLECVQKIIRIESEFMATDVSQPRPAPGSANTAPRKGRWGWIGIGFTALIIGAYLLLQSITVLPPKVAYALGFKERYEQQLVEEKVRRDLEIDEQMEKSGPASTEKYHFDEPSDRTFVAKIEGGLTDISLDGNILRPDGTILNPDQMIRERVRPTALKPVTPQDVRALTLAQGPVRLWSNGGITAYQAEKGHNIPTGVVFVSNRVAYSDERWPFIKHPNEKGEMQDANPRNPSYPVERQITRDVTAIANGYNFVLALRAGGKVWGSGGNEYGQLGTDSPSYRGFTKPVDGLQDVVGIAAGIVHGLALRKDGTVWRWGQTYLDSRFGEYDYRLRHNRAGATPETRAPTGFNPVATQVKGLPPIKKVAAAGKSSVALAIDGTVWVWGNSDACVAGTSYLQPDYAKFAKTKKTPDGSLADFVDEPFPVTGVRDVVEIAVAGTHVLALLKDGTVWGWGNKGAPIGRAETLENSKRDPYCELPRRLRGFDNVKQIFTTPNVSAIVKQDDTLWMMGRCPMCDYRTFEPSYNYIMKPLPGEGGKRVLVFEIFSLPTSGITYSDPMQQAEFGFYWVDDSTGRVDGIAPWEPGYLRAALTPQRATAVYTLPEKRGAQKKVIVDTTDPKRMLAFYLIAKGSLEQWRERNPDNQPGRELTQVHRDGSLTAPFPDQTDFGNEPMAFSSIPFANPGGVMGFSSKQFVKFRNLRPSSGDHSIVWELVAVEEKHRSPTGLRLDGHSYHVHGLQFLNYPELPNHMMAGTDDYERFRTRKPEDVRRTQALRILR